MECEMIALATTSEKESWLKCSLAQTFYEKNIWHSRVDQLL